ncbi:MAG: hypothetical protein MH204_09045 [Fimbriimonadaceae bacterium]|nr:hypothetical protein [Fimbriimonadaceae bacterium]
MSRISHDHPLAILLRELIHTAVVKHVATSGSPPVEAYLTDLLLDFMEAEALDRVKGADGAPVTSLTDLIAQGDVTVHADSFEREREVHRHLGDLMMFGTGLYPDLIRRLRTRLPEDLQIDPAGQGRESYAIVSTFDSGPWAQEAPTFRGLSEGFEDWSWVLSHVGRASGLVHMA